MNKRILELAESVDPTAWGQQHPDDDAWCVKFAELIVRECCRIVDIWSDEAPCSEGYDKFTVGKLKEHFGVTE